MPKSTVIHMYALEAKLETKNSETTVLFIMLIVRDHCPITILIRQQPQ